MNRFFTARYLGVESGTDIWRRDSNTLISRIGKDINAHHLGFWIDTYMSMLYGDHPMSMSQVRSNVRQSYIKSPAININNQSSYGV